MQHVEKPCVCSRPFDLRKALGCPKVLAIVSLGVVKVWRDNLQSLHKTQTQGARTHPSVCMLTCNGVKETDAVPETDALRNVVMRPDSCCRRRCMRLEMEPPFFRCSRARTWITYRLGKDGGLGYQKIPTWPFCFTTRCACAST